MNILRGAELPVRKLSASHSPSLDLCRMSGNRSSMRSIDKAYDGGDDICRNPLADQPTLHSLDLTHHRGGVHSSHSSIDRKRAIDEVSIHSASRAYDQQYYDGGRTRNMDESSIRSYNNKRGSDLSLRSDDHRYGVSNRMNADFDRESRRGSDVSNHLASTLPLQRRPFYTSNEYGIANISESE